MICLGRMAETSKAGIRKDLSLKEGPMAYQLVGEVTAHQACDAYRACERGPAHWD